MIDWSKLKPNKSCAVCLHWDKCEKPEVLKILELDDPVERLKKEEELAKKCKDYTKDDVCGEFYVI